MLTLLVAQTWQTKLTALHVGTFPWEPPPAPQPMVNPTVPSNVPRPQPNPSIAPPSSSSPVPSNAPNTVRIKTEPGYEPQGYQAGSLPPNYSHGLAQQRAAQNLQQKFGAGASSQIHQLQTQAAMGVPGGQPQRAPLNIQLPPQFSEQQRQDQLEYQRRQRAQQVQQYHNLQQAQQRAPVANSQTDGPDDWDDFVAQRRLDASKTSGRADLTIKEHVEQMNRAMEGGGLMMPLTEQPKQRPSKKRRVSPEQRYSVSIFAAGQSSGSRLIHGAPQLDGPGDEDEDEDDKTGIKDELFDDDDDEDAINSDLDDPDDALPEEEQEEGKPNQVMLCTYDKVARVKNKWKCTLKDGVLITGGREYVFHRAQGEFEW